MNRLIWKLFIYGLAQEEAMVMPTSWIDGGTCHYSKEPIRWWCLSRPSKTHRKEDVKGSIATSEKIYIATYILGTNYEVAVCL